MYIYDMVQFLKAKIDTYLLELGIDASFDTS